MRAATTVAILALLPGCYFLPGATGTRTRGASTAAGSSAQAQPAAAQPRTDPAFEHTAEERDAFIAEQTDGYEPVGEPVNGQLGRFAPWPVELARGRCYRMVVRFDETAELSEHAKRGLVFLYRAPGEPQVNGGPGVHGPGAVASAGCPQSSREATFDIWANWGSATDRSRVHDLGTGGFTAQLYAKPISEQELAERQAERERQIAEQRAHQRQREAELRQREAELEQREAEMRRRESRQPSGTSSAAPSGPVRVRVTLRNRCDESVRLFFGDKPKFGSGTYSRLGSNSSRSYSGDAGDMIWIVDDSKNGLSSVSLSEGIDEVRILESCTGFQVR